MLLSRFADLLTFYCFVPEKVYVKLSFVGLNLNNPHKAYQLMSIFLQNFRNKILFTVTHSTIYFWSY